MPIEMSWPMTQQMLILRDNSEQSTDFFHLFTYPRSHVVAESQGANIGSIRDSQGLEDAPWNRLADGTCNKHGEAGGEERNEDGRNHGYHGDLHRPSIANALGNPAVQNEPDDGTSLKTHEIGKLDMIGYREGRFPDSPGQSC